jgi:hypothetical protein
VPGIFDVPQAPGVDAPGVVRSLATGESADRLTESDVLSEPSAASSPVPRAQPSISPAKPVVVSVAPPAPPKPKVSSAPSTGHVLRGYASYYCDAGSSPCTTGYPDGTGFDAYAAAGPKLRAALGSNWRGRIVSVDGIRVKLIDWCQCYKGQSNEKLLDLYHDVYLRTGSPVTIRW